MDMILKTTLIWVFCFAACVSAALPVSIGNPGKVVLGFSADARPKSFLANGVEHLDVSDPGAGFTLHGSDSGGRGAVEFRFSSMSFDGRQAVISLSPQSRVTFSVNITNRYLAFRLVRVEGIPRQNLLWLRLHMNLGSGVKCVPLDFMTKVHGGAREVHFPWLWKRTDNLPMGGFALYAPSSPEDEDETLLHIWAGEKLPHPKGAGDWNVETARKWLVEWQQMFADQSQMLISASSNQELYQLADYAATLDVKRLYMHTDTWRGEYWPNQFSFLRLNPQVFPNGEEDFNKFSDYARSKGMGITIHTVSGSIAPNDPDYVAGKVDPRLARWIDGTLVDPVSETDTVLRFRPNSGQEWPLHLDRPITGPSHVDPWNDIRVIRIGNELIDVANFTDTDKDVWTLEGCTRGLYKNGASAHAAGAEIVGLIRPYGQVFTADNDSTLVDEIAERMAGFYNRNGVVHIEQDAGEIHTVNHPWGYEKFAEAIYTRLEHPVTSNNSGGTTMPCQFEYRFNSSRSVLAARKQVLVPLMIERNGRLATGPYELLSSVGREVAAGNRSVGIQKPEPMFGVSMETLEQHGLAQLAASTVRTWKELGPFLAQDQRQMIRAAGDEVIHRAELAEGGFNVTPLRMLMRPGIDVGWHQGSEFGPIVPRQYVRSGDSMEVENPWSQQVPEFVIRVMSAMGHGDHHTQTSSTDPGVSHDQDLIDAYNTGTGQRASINSDGAGEGGPAIQPRASDLQSPGDHQFFDVDGGIRIRYENNRNEEIYQPDTLPFWRPGGSMDGGRGIGLTIHGDGSNAVLVVQVHCAGPRDYVVPIDFKGPREIIIPCGEVAWADRRWGWRFETKDSRYGNVAQVNIGFGKVPARTIVDVAVSKLRILGERPVLLRHPVLAINDGTMEILGDVSSGSYLWYQGGDKVTVHDPNWKKIAELPLRISGFSAPEGRMNIRVDARRSAADAWFECQFFVRGGAMMVSRDMDSKD